VAFGFVIWISNRATYWRYVAAVITLFFAGFITHYLYPAAPPWMAYNEGLLPEVHRVLGSTLSKLSTGDGLNLAYQNFSPNAVAAIPSLHAGIPALLSLIAMSLYGWRASVTLLYVGASGVAWVYLGEHYFVDVLAGWIYAVPVFLIVWVGLPHLVRKLPTVHWPQRIRLRAVPDWPLAIAALAFITFVWFNPLVYAPLQSDGDVDADAPPALECPVQPDDAVAVECPQP
jgi:hypothetical protein